MPRRNRQRGRAQPAALPADDERLVDGWIAYVTTEADEHFAACDEVSTRMFEGADDAWPLLLRLIERVPDEHLGTAGAGPLETLLRWHGAIFGPRAVEQAWRDPRFCACLSAVWLRLSAVTPKVAGQIARVTGGAVLFFPTEDDSPPVSRAGSHSKR